MAAILVTRILPRSSSATYSASSTIRIMPESSSPSVATSKLASLIEVLMTNGTPIPKRMLKMLEPKALLTAMSPCPALATRIDAIASGADVPAAQKVRPMNVDEMPSRQPAFSAHAIMKKTSKPSHAIDAAIATQTNAWRWPWLLGIVRWKQSANGHPTTKSSLPRSGACRGHSKGEWTPCTTSSSSSCSPTHSR